MYLPRLHVVMMNVLVLVHVGPRWGKEVQRSCLLHHPYMVKTEQHKCTEDMSPPSVSWPHFLPKGLASLALCSATGNLLVVGCSGFVSRKWSLCSVRWEVVERRLESQQNYLLVLRSKCSSVELSFLMENSLQAAVVHPFPCPAPRPPPPPHRLTRGLGLL